MSGSADVPIVVATGQACSIECGICENGTSPVREFLGGLNERDRAKVFALLQRMADHGEINNPERFKHLSGQLCEFKHGQIRIACFREGRRWILTFGFKKKKDRWRKAQLERAERIMDEHIAQEAIKHEDEQSKDQGHDRAHSGRGVRKH